MWKMEGKGTVCEVETGAKDDLPVIKGSKTDEVKGEKTHKKVRPDA